MDQNDRKIIDDLFSKLAEAERHAPPRDSQADALIREHLGQQPNAPYYMLQAIAVQQQAIEALQQRVEHLERELRSQSAGGLFSRLFGAPSTPPRPVHAASPHHGGAHAPHGASAWGRPHSQGGFMAGAMQTAMGVAGGVLIGNALAGMLAPDEAAAEEPQTEPDDGSDFGADEEF